MKVLNVVCSFGLLLIFTISGHAQNDFPDLLPHNILTIKWNQQGTQYAVGYVDGTVQIYENEQLQIDISNAHSGWINGIAFSPDSNRIITIGYDNALKIWDVISGVLIIEFLDISDALQGVEWSPDGDMIITIGIGEDNFIIADTSNDTYSIHQTINIGSTYDIDYSPNNDVIALTNVSLDILILNPTDYDFLRSLDATPDTDFFYPPNEFSTTLAWHPTDNLVANGKVNAWIHIWDLDSSSDNLPLLRLQANDGFSDDAQIPFEYAVRDITFNADGTIISSISADGTVRRWDSETGEMLLDINLGEDILSADFSPDGNILVYSTYAISETPPILINIDDIMCQALENCSQ